MITKNASPRGLHFFLSIARSSCARGEGAKITRKGWFYSFQTADGASSV